MARRKSWKLNPAADIGSKPLKTVYKQILQISASGEIADLSGSGTGVYLPGDGEIVAETYTISSSITNIQILKNSGSTEFGDTSDDTHIFIGNITASGNISASGYISASSFAGDGSGITGLSSAAISSYTSTGDNRVVTSKDSSGIQGEANLTFDGSGLSVTGHITASRHISSSLSSTGSFGHLMVGGGNFSSASLAAGGGGGSSEFTSAGISGSWQGQNFISSSATISGSWQGELSSSTMTFVGGGVTGSSTSTGSFGAVHVRGNISASGTVYAAAFSNPDGPSIDFSDNLAVTGHITASGNISASGNLYATPQLQYNTSSISSTGNVQGDIVKFGNTTTVAGAIYAHTGSGWVLAHSGSSGNASSSLGLAAGTNSTTNGMLLRGMANIGYDPGGDNGCALYLQAPGSASNIATTTSDHIGRIVGWNYGSDTIYFNPDNTWVKV